jgi:uncharacterized protein (TIGR00375 family)
MRRVYADLHIHIGRAQDRPVKITAARDLTFANIARECATRKGIEIAGIVDCACPPVLREIEGLVASGEMVELPGGGLRYRPTADAATTVILGSELETVEPGGGVSHHVSYFPTLSQLRDFSEIIGRVVTNRDLSSQRCRLPAQRLFEITHSVGGVFVPAHAFTPHKSLYGNCVRRMVEMFSPQALAAIPAIELGLSADSYLADCIAELAGVTFLSNSDAHSLPKIAREYNVLEIEEPSYHELVLALRLGGGRRVDANYGLDPRLGKYHRTYCPKCDWIEIAPPPIMACTRCGGDEVAKGVKDRLAEIGDFAEPHPPPHRPPYHYQVPLQFLPGIGAVKLNRLLNRFGTEMNVLHDVALDELSTVVGTGLGERILLARAGELPLQAGGGGKYGRALQSDAETQLDLALD